MNTEQAEATSNSECNEQTSAPTEIATEQRLWTLFLLLLTDPYTTAGKI